MPILLSKKQHRAAKLAALCESYRTGKIPVLHYLVIVLRRLS